MRFGQVWYVLMPSAAGTMSSGAAAGPRLRAWMGREVGRIASALAGALRRWRHVMRRRATIRELERLNDMMLKDVGLTRGEIWHLAETLAAEPEKE